MPNDSSMSTRSTGGQHQLLSFGCRWMAVANRPLCPTHGPPTKRRTCGCCNAAYMRGYMRRLRREAPAHAIWARAKDRARRLGIPFNLPPSAVVIPVRCPVLGIPIVVGTVRSMNSPSLDRIKPSDGYVQGNVRVLSDKANRLKGNRTARELKDRAHNGAPNLRSDYAKVADYVNREALLAEVRAKAAASGPFREDWAKIAKFLDHRFQRGSIR